MEEIRAKAVTEKLTVGQLVHIDGYGGFCHRSAGTVGEIIRRYSEHTGAPYAVYVIKETGYKFDGRTGWAITGPTAYFIEEIKAFSELKAGGEGVPKWASALK